MSEEITLARFRAKSEFSDWTVRCTACSWLWGQDSRNDELLTLSIVGPDTAVKAIRALLIDVSLACRFRIETEDDGCSSILDRPKRPGGKIGYQTAVAKLARGAYHLVAKAKLDGLILETSDDALWEELIGPRFTTPVLRAWIPEIRQRLVRDDLLREAHGYCSAAGLLTCGPVELDEIVSDLVKERRVKLCA